MSLTVVNKLKQSNREKENMKLPSKTPLFLRALAAALLIGTGPAALASPFVPLNGAQSRPFYVIAHNPNTLEAVTNALKNGCNALERDITEITCSGKEV